MVSDLAKVVCSFVVRTAEADNVFDASSIFCFIDSQ